MNLLKQFAILILLLCLCISRLWATENPHTLYVSQLGSDQWSGTLPQPNAGKTDGPLASLQAAQMKVREFLVNNKNTNIQVLVREGTFSIKEPLVFNAEDGGSEQAPVVWKTFPGEKAIINGGAPITNWKKLKENIPGLPAQIKKNVWVADVLKGKKFYCLFDENGYLPRARSPRFESSESLEGVDRYHLRFGKGDLTKINNLKDAEIFIRNTNWCVHYLPIKEIDYTRNILTTSQPGTYGLDTRQRWQYDTRKPLWGFYIENVVEYLDEPGEWVLDSEKGKLYYWPNNNASPQNIDMPVVSELFSIQGSIDSMKWVNYIKIDGFTFQHTDRLTWDKGRIDTQHGWGVFDAGYAAVVLRGANHIKITNCTFDYCGGSAVKVGIHTWQNEVVNNEMKNLGGAGVEMIGYGPGNLDENHHHTIARNNIHHNGLMWLHSAGIYIVNSGSNSISNNLVHHMPYCGIIMVGGRETLFTKQDRGEVWDGGQYIRYDEIPKQVDECKHWPNLIGFIHSRFNIIEHNDIQHVMQKLGDGNAIYVSGAGWGNVLRRNYIHDIDCEVGAAIRTDVSQFYTEISENVIRDISSGGIAINSINDVVNNVIINCGYYSFLPNSAGNCNSELYGANFRRNIMIQEVSKMRKYGLLNNIVSPFYVEGNWPGVIGKFKEPMIDNNILWCTDDIAAAQQALEKCRNEYGKEIHSIAADPMFVDFDKGDYRFKQGSPAAKLGIIPIVKYGLVESVGPNQNTENK